MANLNEVLERHRHSLLEKQHTIGVGIGLKETKGKTTKLKCLIIYVDKKVPMSKLDINDKIPDEIDHIITDVKEIGKIKALDTLIPSTFTGKRTDRWRPAPGGVSIGHGKITAGTLGMRIDTSDDSYILSNNHVLANSNDAKVGDIIYQPGPHDSPISNANKIGVLYDWIPIQFSSECRVVKGIIVILNAFAKLKKSRYRFKAEKQTVANEIDAAICRPYNKDDVKLDILEIGVPNGFVVAEIGDDVMKSGRTTGFTKGTVIDIDATIKVQYGKETAVFDNQIIATCKCAGGDSGSVLVKDSTKKPVVGLLFAGSPTVSIYNHIAKVKKALNI